MARFVVTVLEAVRKKVSPSVCQDQRPMHWAKKVEPVPHLVNAEKILILIVKVLL
jgi:hypothetical protein